MPSTTRTLLSALAGAASVLAHGHVDNIVINGVSYAGYDVTTLPYESDPPVVVGWATEATDNGYVAPDAYGSGDIICHRNGTNAKGHAQVAAGDSIYIQWTAWPDSHKGPVMDYLASCGDSCETVDKTTLEFFKIDEVGLVDGSTVPGTYGDDELIANGNGWLVEIPTNIKPGFYVLRHEIIALHSAENTDGAQNYPQCFNLEITGSGTEQPSGVLGTELYKETDAGILFNIYTTVTSYPVPGPTVISGASAVSQTSSAIASSGTPTTGSALATGDAAAGTTAAATPAATSAAATSAAVVVETSAAAVSTPAVVSTPAAVSTPVVVSTPAAVETTAAPAEAASTTVVAAQPTSTRVSCSKKKRRHARDVAVIAA